MIKFEIKLSLYHWFVILICIGTIIRYDWYYFYINSLKYPNSKPVFSDRNMLLNAVSKVLSCWNKNQNPILYDEYLNNLRSILELDLLQWVTQYEFTG